MNIWILNHYAGGPNCSSTRHYDFGKQLVDRGHKVTIFASGFDHKKFIEERLNPGEKWKIQDFSGVRFLWIRTTPYKGNEWHRIVNMLSYAWRTVLVGTKLKEKPDIIIGSCVHPFAVLSAYILAKCKKSRFFFEVRDLWPQTLVDMGFLSEHSFIVWFLRRLEKFLYHKAEKIISLLPRAELYITKLGIPKEKIVWIPNGVDLSRYERVEKYDGGVSKPFTIMYLGAHGEANALNTVLDAAKILQNKGIDNLKFIFIGDGPEKRKLMGYVKNSGINNVEFYDTIPKDQLYKKIGTADAFIFCFKGLPLFKYGISPNKLFDYLASGRPILFSCSAEANNLVEEAKAGISVPPQDPEALANAVIELINLNPEKRIEMGENGLEYVKKYYDIRVLADKLEEILLQ